MRQHQPKKQTGNILSSFGSVSSCQVQGLCWLDMWQMGKGRYLTNGVGIFCLWENLKFMELFMFSSSWVSLNKFIFPGICLLHLFLDLANWNCFIRRGKAQNATFYKELTVQFYADQRKKKLLIIGLESVPKLPISENSILQIQLICCCIVYCLSHVNSCEQRFTSHHCFSLSSRASSPVIFDIKGLTNILRSFPLDHTGNCLACNIKQTFDV